MTHLRLVKDLPTPKDEPVAYGLVATYLAGLAARYGLNIDKDAILVVLGVVSTVVTLIARRRTVAIHPSTGTTVGSADVVAGIPVAPPKAA